MFTPSRAVVRIGAACGLILFAAACTKPSDGTANGPTTVPSVVVTTAPPGPEGRADIPNPSDALDATSTPLTADAVVRVEAVTFRSEGATVAARVSMPVLTPARHACVVMVHGLGGSKADSEATWAAFALAGIGTIAIDARNHGDRKPADFLAVVGSAEGFATTLQGTAVDARQAIDYLETRPECDPARLGYFGVSMGALVGTLVAGSDERVKAPVFFAGGGDWRTILETSNNEAIDRIRNQPGGIDAAVAVLDPVDPVRFVPTIAPRSMLMVDGNADPTIPPAAAKAMFAAANDPKRIEWWTGGHGPEGLETIRVLGIVTQWFTSKL